MDKEFFLNAGIPPSLHFKPTWQSPSSAMEIQPLELNCSSGQSSDCFLNPNWEKSTDQYIHFDSALSSMGSSPVAPNPNDSFVIRELIGKLGNIGGNNSTNNSCYSTPLNSPPKLTFPIMDQLVKENLSNLGNSPPLNPNLADLMGDPGFAERAARFSCFGSRSFNGRTSQVGLNNTELPYRSTTPLLANAKLPRVSSSPSLKATGSQLGVQENKMKDATEFANSREESSVIEQIPGGEIGLKASNDVNCRKRKTTSRGKEKELAPSPPAKATKVAEADNDLNGNENGGVKTEEEQKWSTEDAGDDGQNHRQTDNPKPSEPLKDYIHVRARRGQATDSHSLAERVRREKISERMKLLQDLVPGCNKVTGKALMLDEIINYVQSLQRQVEFLSMKLASRMDFNMETHASKDIFQSNGPVQHPGYPLDSSASALYGHQPQQNPLPQTNIPNGGVTECSVDLLDSALFRNLNMALPQLDGSSQFPTFSEDDLQSIVQMGFGNNPIQEMPFQLHSFHVQAEIKNPT